MANGVMGQPAAPLILTHDWRNCFGVFVWFLANDSYATAENLPPLQPSIPQCFEAVVSVAWRASIEYKRLSNLYPRVLFWNGSRQTTDRETDDPGLPEKRDKHIGINTYCWMKIMKMVASRIYMHDKDLLQWAFKPDGAHNFTQSTLHTAKKILHKKQQRQPNNNASIQCLSAACLPLSTI